MKNPGTHNVIPAHILFAAAALISYLGGYFLFALDRSIVSWIFLIHFLTPQLLALFVVIAYVVAYYASAFKVREKDYPLILAAAAFLLALPFSSLPQFNYDSSTYYAAARYLQEKGLVEGLLTLRGAGYDSLPGYPLMLSIVCGFSEGYLPAQVLHLLLYAALSLLVFLIGQRLWDGEMGFLAGLLTMSTPLLLSNHWFLLPDVPLTVFALASLYLGLKCLDDSRWLVLALPVFLFTASIKVAGLFYLFSVLTPVLILHLLEKRKKVNLSRLSVFLAIILLALAAASYSIPSLWERALTKLIFLSPVDNLMRFVTIADREPSTTLLFQVGFPQCMLVALFSYLSLKRRFDRRNIILYFWILVPFLVLHDIKTRYLMPVFPAFSLAAALALQKLADKRGRKLIAYFACAVMAAVTVYSVPQVVSGYAVKNLQNMALETNSLDAKTVGVYDYQEPPYPTYHLPAEASAIADYYSGKDIIFLGFNSQYVMQSWPTKETQLLEAVYPSRNITPDGMDELLTENYTLQDSSSGGRLSSYDTYYARLYLRKPGKGGPTDAILYVSNMDVWSDEIVNKTFFCGNYAYSFYCKDYVYRGSIWFFNVLPQTYRFGPLELSGSYGTGVESWLGENMFLMKPPNVGQVNETYNVIVPEDTVLRFSVSLRPDTWHPLKGDGVEFTVLGEADGVSHVLYDRYIDPKNDPGDRRLFEAEVDVSEYWGHNATFVFQTRSGPRNSSIYDTAGWGNPRLIKIE